MADATCSIADCNRGGRIRRTWCEYHYTRWRKTGDPCTPPQRAANRRLTDRSSQACAQPGCDQSGQLRRGLCRPHYCRWRKSPAGVSELGTAPSRYVVGKECAVDGCHGNYRITRGLCGKHYGRLRRHGSPEWQPAPKLPKALKPRKDRASSAQGRATRTKNVLCVVPTCDRRATALDWCEAHRKRFRKYGDVRADIALGQRGYPPASQCSADGCSERPSGRGLCKAHYNQMFRTALARQRVRPPCSIDGCDAPQHSKTWCSVHYHRWVERGDPLAVVRYRTRVQPDACSVDGCAVKPRVKGMCLPHYRQAHYRANKGKKNAQSRQNYLNNRIERIANCERRRRQLRDGLTRAERSLSNTYRRVIANDPCWYCGSPGIHFDHFYPVSKGGTDHWWNLVRACADCNLRKFTRCGTWYLLRPKSVST